MQAPICFPFVGHLSSLKDWTSRAAVLRDNNIEVTKKKELIETQKDVTFPLTNIAFELVCLFVFERCAAPEWLKSSAVVSL